MATSVKQRIQCFQNALPLFLKAQEDYKSNRKLGTRPRKERKK